MSSDESEPAWAERHARNTGLVVKRLRGSRSLQWLSDETAKLGHRVPKTSIAELETGKRKAVAVTDLIVLAAALRVPPLDLLVGDPLSDFEALPGVTLPAIKALNWMVGEAPEGSALGPVAESERFLYYQLVRDREGMRSMLKEALDEQPADAEGKRAKEAKVKTLQGVLATLDKALLTVARSDEERRSGPIVGKS